MSIHTQENDLDHQMKGILRGLRARWQAAVNTGKTKAESLDAYIWENPQVAGLALYAFVGDHYGGELDDALAQLEGE